MNGLGSSASIAPGSRAGATEYDYTPGYYAVFFYDPDGIKLELLHRPTYWEWLRGH